MVKRKKLKKTYRIKKRKLIIKSRFFWLFLLFLVLILTTFYFCIFWEKFQVKEIIISGNNKISTEEIKNIVSERINRKILSFWLPSFLSKKEKYEIKTKSIFLANLKKIKEEILNKYPAIDDLKIKRKFSNTLILEVKERNPFAVFCDQECFFLDENGVIFGNYKNSSLEKELIIRFLEEKREIFLGQEIVKKEILEVVSKIKKNLKENFQLDIKEAMVDLPSRLNIKTDERWQIYFDLESDIDLQITKLNLLLKEEIPPENRKNLEYIDLRFTRVYYKYK